MSNLVYQLIFPASNALITVLATSVFNASDSSLHLCLSQNVAMKPPATKHKIPTLITIISQY